MDSPLEKHTGAELLSRFMAGDESAFREIVTLYKDSLYTFLRQFLNDRDLIEDVFQETFLQLFSSRESFDLNRPLRPWLFTIAANKAKDALRRQHRSAAITIGSMADAEDMSFDEAINNITSVTSIPYEEMEENEIAAQVRQIIANMPDNLREILILAYFNKFSYKQMTDILSIPIGTVKSRLHTAVNRFAKDWTAFMRSKKHK